MFWLLKLRGSLVFEHWFAKILKKLKWKPLISSVSVQVGALGCFKSLVLKGRF